MSVRVFAPAKINVTLEVGAPRDDGYHPLQSAVLFAGEGDWIEASPAEALTLKISGPFASGLDAGADNLVLRAARLLDPKRGAALSLEKNLPIASGIGGGSSDAAATLFALNQIWNLKHSIEDLAHISKALGADVPVCVHKRSAWMTGLGDVVAPLEAPDVDVVLINPRKPLPTPSVYRRFDDMRLGKNFAVRPAPMWRDVEDLIEAVRTFGNDLEAPAVSAMPELESLLAILRADPRTLCASLSGSGATCFAITRSGDSASELAKDLGARKRDWWVCATTLGRS